MKDKLVETIAASGVASVEDAREIAHLIDISPEFKRDSHRYLFVLELNTIYGSLKTMPNTPEFKELRERLSLKSFRQKFPTTEELIRMLGAIASYLSKTTNASVHSVQDVLVDMTAHARDTRKMRERFSAQENARKSVRRVIPPHLFFVIQKRAQA